MCSKTNKKLSYKYLKFLQKQLKNRSSMVYANVCSTPNNYINYENITETSEPVRTKKETTLIISVLV